MAEQFLDEWGGMSGCSGSSFLMRVEREIGTRGAFNGSEEKPAVLDSRSCFGKRKACEGDGCNDGLSSSRFP